MQALGGVTLLRSPAHGTSIRLRGRCSPCACHVSREHTAAVTAILRRPGTAAREEAAIGRREFAALSSAAVFCETSAEGVRGRLCSPVGERLLYAYLHLALHLQYWRRLVRRRPGQYQHWVVLATSPAQCCDDHTCSYASFVVLSLPVWRRQQQQQQQYLSKYFWKHAHSKSTIEVELTRQGIAPPTIRGVGRADVVWS